MLDNTFFAMTSSFRAVLGVAENFGRLRSMFGHIWYSLNVFRLFRWLYKRLMRLMGYKVMDSAASVAWNEAYNGASAAATAGGSGGYNWPTIAFFGVLISTPYLISKFLLPKYEGKIVFYYLKQVLICLLNQIKHKILKTILFIYKKISATVVLLIRHKFINEYFSCCWAVMVSMYCFVLMLFTSSFFYCP